MSSLWIPVIASILWSVACVFGVRRVLSTKPAGPLAHDRLLLIIAILSVGLAPWISLIVYVADDGKSVFGGSVNIVVAAVLFLASLRARKLSQMPAEQAQSNLPFRQKSAALMALTLAVVYAVYFLMTWSHPSLAIPLFFGSALLLIVVATAGHIVLALFHAPVEDADTPADERDREAERYAIKNAYLVLAWGIWVVPAACLLKSPLWIIANLAFAFAVLAEIVRYLSLVRYYQRGE